MFIYGELGKSSYYPPQNLKAKEMQKGEIALSHQRESGQ